MLFIEKPPPDRHFFIYYLKQLMSILRIQIFIIIASLAACKSADPTSKKTLAEHVSYPESSSASLLTTKECTAKDSIEQLGNMINNAFSSFKAVYQVDHSYAADCVTSQSEDTLRLTELSFKIISFLSMTIKNGTAIFHEEIDKTIDSILFDTIWTYHKQDSTKFNLKKTGYTITYTSPANCVDLERLFEWIIDIECPRRIKPIHGRHIYHDENCRTDEFCDDLE